MGLESQGTVCRAAYPNENFLRESSPHLRALIEHNPVAVIFMDERHRIRMCNRAFEQLFLYREDEILGRGLEELIADGEEWKATQEQASQLVTTENLRIATIRRKRDGSPVEVEVYGLPLMLDARVMGAFALFLDVTERKRAEEALRASEQRYRLLFERNLAGVYRTNLDGQILECNEAFARMFGFASLEEVRRHTAWELHYESGEREDCMLYLKEFRTVSNVEVRLRRLDGTPIWVLQNCTLIPNENGGQDIVEGTLIDITERKRAEDALRRLSLRLLRLQDEERRRIARELHDTIAQQLAAVAMYLSVIRRSAEALDAQGRQALEESLALVEECSRETRTFSYLLHPPLLDEAGLLSALRWYADGFGRRSGIQVNLEVPTPPGRLPREVETTLFRIVQESLTNVHRHSGSARATILLARVDGEIRLEVRDEGQGIRPGALDRGESGVASLGVGIAGMRERVKQLGGRLDIESSWQGTTVRAFLRLQGSEVIEHHADHAGRRSRGGAARPAGATAGKAKLGNLRRSRHRP